MANARKTQNIPDASLSTHNGFSLITNEKLLQIYSTMLKCRMLEERLHVASAGTNGTSRVASTSVHIAAVAGAAIDLGRGDTLAPSPGALTPCFAKGMPLVHVFASVHGNGGGLRLSFASWNLIRPSLKADKQIERALVVAATCKAQRKKKVVAVFSSDASGAASELADAMKLAGKKKLPILFVRETKLHDDHWVMRAREYGFPGVAVEDDDAVAVYRVATEALAHARRGNGPTLIECKPWQFNEAGAGNQRHTMHPIRKMESFLAGKGLFSRKLKTRVVEEFNHELNAAIRAVSS